MNLYLKNRFNENPVYGIFERLLRIQNNDLCRVPIIHIICHY